MIQEAGKLEQEVKDQKNNIAELIRQIQRLKADLETLTKQVSISQHPRRAQRLDNRGASNAQ